MVDISFLAGFNFKKLVSVSARYNYVKFREGKLNYIDKPFGRQSQAESYKRRKGVNNNNIIVTKGGMGSGYPNIL